MRTRACCATALLVVLLAASGCQRLNHEQTLALEGGDIKVLRFDPPRSEQKVTAQVSSPGAPVSAFLVRDSEAAAAQQAVEQGKAPASPLAAGERAEDISLEATVPAKTGFALLIRADKKSSVKVKVTGR